MAALLAGLPVTVPGATVNRLCASGLEAVSMAARAVRGGDGDLYLAGGVESMTRAPLVTLKSDKRFARGVPETADTTIGWRFVNPRMEELYPVVSLGETAENVAERYEVTRADQDALALRSHQLAIAAQEAGRFEDELVPVELNGKEPRTSPPTRARAPTPRSRSSPSCGRSSARAARSPPATRRRSTTAPPAW